MHSSDEAPEVSATPKPSRFSYLAGIFLLVDDDEGVLGRLPLRLGDGALHLGPLAADHFVGLALGLRHGLLKLRHGLPLDLIHGLFWKECGDRGSQACRTCNITCIVSPCHHNFKFTEVNVGLGLQIHVHVQMQKQFSVSPLNRP